jgi:hypothetical protein
MMKVDPHSHVGLINSAVTDMAAVVTLSPPLSRFQAGNESLSSTADNPKNMLAQFFCNFSDGQLMYHDQDIATGRRTSISNLTQNMGKRGLQI